MKNRNYKTGQYEHEWCFMANTNTKKGDLLQCNHKQCELWSYMGDRPYFKMSYEDFIAKHESGEIDAKETLGYPSGTKRI